MLVLLAAGSCLRFKRSRGESHLDELACAELVLQTEAQWPVLVCQVPMLVTVGTTIVCLASVRPDCSALAPRVSRHCAGKGGCRATVPGLAHAQLGMQGLFGVPLTSMVIVRARASSCIAHTVMLSAMRLLRRPWPSHLPGLPLRPSRP